MKKSRYVVKTQNANGDKIYYNLRNGIGIKVSNKIFNSLDELNVNPKINEILEKSNFVYNPNEADEVLEEYKLKNQNETLHLIVLPHQNCNFRCVYCYEKFDKNKMTSEVEEGTINLVKRKLSNGSFKNFAVSWFGGEPLLGTDVIERLSKEFRGLASKYNVRYFSDITSNGYGLTNKVIDMLLENEVTNFQITLDGIKNTHDKQRTLKGGQPTYDKIINNLKNMSTKQKKFRVMIRMNVGVDNLKYVDQHIKEMKQSFGEDKRFQLYFHNIGHWGGENDSQVNICSKDLTFNLLSKTLDYEMNAISASTKIKPNSTCYAASPNSFVIGVDGLIYKCTVALYDDVNIVGKLKRNGELELDEEKMKLWTEGGVNDGHCKNCFFASSCHGDSCPLIRIRDKIRPCPDAKKQVKQYVELMDRQGYKFIEINPKKEKEVFI
ncbi:radical SAM protein [Bacillus cereus]|nr:radical SAM protein [Bacillus cereus]